MRGGDRPDEGRRRAVIEGVTPQVDGGRFAAKRIRGDRVTVGMDAFCDGHDELSAALLYRHEDEEEWHEVPMEPQRNDRWTGSFVAEELGRYLVRTVAWVDHFKTWRHDLEKRLAAGQEVEQELRIGARLVEEAAGRASGADRRRLEELAAALRGGPDAGGQGGDRPGQGPRQGARPDDADGDGAPGRGGGSSSRDRRASGEERRTRSTQAGVRTATAPSRARTRVRSGTERDAAENPIGTGAAPEQVALDPELERLVARYPDRSLATWLDRELPIAVDRERARYSTWYELFPRSASAEPGRHGTFRDVEELLPYVRDMGFDVLYLPPIHPIGRTHRKGPNNATTAGAGDPGSPWAIGGPEGGHDAVHPELGTLEDFRRLVRRAREEGIEIALDIAFQCSPDHPWVREHPEWFRRRPDGSIQYAENPPKKYEDIYPFDFESEAWEELWEALAGVFFHWIEQGVRIFRVDNPHTKPLPFWEWVIAHIRARYPDVLFLSEAFTRPKVMYRLAKLGFTQSYTYFTWRNGSRELRAYLEELSKPPVSDFFRPNFWPNTPDILTEYLQTGGRGAFMARLVLAGTLSSSYGIYGPAFELQESVPRHEGSEEYLHSEKYEIRSWDLDRADSLRAFVRHVNRIRRANPALHRTENVRFHDTDNEMLLAYSKASEDGSNVVLVVVNLDPHHVQSGWLHPDLDALGVDVDEEYQVHDLIGGERYLWRGARSFVELNPHVVPAHVFQVVRHTRTEADFEYYL